MRNAAVMAMISLSAIGFAVADGEMRRVRWVQAMRRTLMRINDMIRYERVPLAKLLQSIELHATREQRDLTRLLHACGARLENSVNPQLVEIFAAETERTPGYGVLSQTDRSAFEQVMAELGRTGLDEQLRILSDADERLRQREECLRRDAGRRAQLIRTLGVTGGAALFLLLISREDGHVNIDLLFQIAGVGILIFAVNQVLQKAGREDIAVLASVAGLVVVMFLVVDLVAQLLNNVKSIFGLY